MQTIYHTNMFAPGTAQAVVVAACRLKLDSERPTGNPSTLVGRRAG